jgi:hypothetical protein
LPQVEVEPEIEQLVTLPLQPVTHDTQVSGPPAVPFVPEAPTPPGPPDVAT